jgi:hypothetical protein
VRINVTPIILIVLNCDARSIHNVRIERLWVDVTAQVGSLWAEAFLLLELRHGLDINNPNHIWLLHYLFLRRINEQLVFFAEAWNQHKINVRNGPNRSPADMFGFDMLTQGVRGYQLPIPNDDSAAIVDDEELEVYGVDWEALREDTLLQSHDNNNHIDDDGSSWIGRRGPPERLNRVDVNPPSGIFADEQIGWLDDALVGFLQSGRGQDIAEIWVEALGLTRLLHLNEF